MAFFKYFKPFILFLIYEVFWIVFAFFLEYYFSATFAFSLSPFIPTDSIITELLLVFTLFIPFGGLIGYMIGGYILGPIFLYIHKKIFGTDLIYAIQEKKEVQSISIFYKSFFPIMLAINLTFMMISPDLINFILSSEFLSITSSIAGESLQKSLSLFVLLPFSFGITMFLFSSIWFLKNSGILYSNEKKVKSTSEPYVIRSVGGWFHTLLKGYAGIGVLITYSLVIVDLVQSFLISVDRAILIISLLVWFVVLLMLFLTTIPSLILNEIIRTKSAGYVRKFAKKLGIEDIVEVKFNIEIKYEEQTQVAEENIE
ncbi:MAG: membrane protein of unknown function [Promethearchaeota archaeon]|nr:MAG: membrane protein of unknown function [Candidatus Lokiarchaeota archaeon]